MEAGKRLTVEFEGTECLNFLRPGEFNCPPQAVLLKNNLISVKMRPDHRQHDNDERINHV